MTKATCKCGHEKHEHDRAYPSGKAINCCRLDVGCVCPKFERADKAKVQSQEGRATE